MEAKPTVVYLAHPFASDPVRNLNRVTRMARLLVKLSLAGTLPKFYAPFVPHLALSVYDEDASPSIRPITEALSVRLVQSCDELWLASEVISAGMQLEIAAAEQCGMPILGWTDILGLVPQLADVV
jgi:hypothetical protein